jgi:hypothetical protein
MPAADQAGWQYDAVLSASSHNWEPNCGFGCTDF